MTEEDKLKKLKDIKSNYRSKMGVLQKSKQILFKAFRQKLDSKKLDKLRSKLNDK